MRRSTSTKRRPAVNAHGIPINHQNGFGKHCVECGEWVPEHEGVLGWAAGGVRTVRHVPACGVPFNSPPTPVDVRFKPSA